MLDKEERLQLRKLLADAVPLLCKSSISGHMESQFCIEAMIGITVDEEQIAIICFKETVDLEGRVTSGQYGEGADQEKVENEEHESGALVNDDNDEQYGNDDCVVVEQSDGAGSSQAKVRVKHEPGLSSYDLGGGREKKRMKADEYDESSGVYGTWDIPGGSGGNRGVYSGELKQESYSEHDMDGVFPKQEMQDSQEMMNRMYNDEWEVYNEEEESTEQYYDEDHGQASESLSQPIRSSRGFPRIRGAGRFPGRGGAGASGRARYQNMGRSPGGRGQIRRAGSMAAQSPRFQSNQTMTAGMDNVGLFGGSGAGYTTMVNDLCESLVQQSTQASSSGSPGGDQQFVCHICQAHLSNSTTLRNHIRGTHLALKSVRCNVCGESFKWAMQLARHKKREHGENGSYLQIHNAL